MFLFLLVSFLITLPVPPINPVNKAPSVPNLALFNKSVRGSSDSLSISVGPPKIVTGKQKHYRLK